MTRSNFMFQKGLGFVNSLVATKVAELLVGPLATLKVNVEQLVKDYKPPEHVVESLELTWKGGLWRMALEAALGVQYLHHHRYVCKGGASERKVDASERGEEASEREEDASEREEEPSERKEGVAPRCCCYPRFWACSREEKRKRSRQEKAIFARTAPPSPP
jgi:hypothetical protein